MLARSIRQWLGIGSAALAVVIAYGPLVAAAEPDAVAINPGVPWPATDALGRKLPTPEEVGPPRPNRFVGIFYSPWLNVRNRSSRWDGPNDVSRILAAEPGALSHPDSPLWGPLGSPHYWGQPLYGYYLSDDPWVLRRHAQLLADAGVDTLIFDTTNGVTYRETYLKLCEVFTEVRKHGGHTPQIAFMVNTEAARTAERIYEELYKPTRYRELWFRWLGKPLMLCDPERASPELKEFFTLRRAHWPFTMVNTQNAWHWEAAYPQPYGYTGDPQKPEQVNVSVAQNLRASDGKVTNMSRFNARGRSFHDGKADPSAEARNRGANFQEQWKRALELDPPFVMVTGWNEWIAGRFSSPTEPVMFVDQFSEEYSRDIEPMKDGHGDNFYYQLVANVRRYKGVVPIPKPTAPKTIRIEGGFEQWGDVGPEYKGHVDETIPRDHDGAAGLHYTNPTGRNEPVVAKVARDAKNVHFYIRTRAPLTPVTDPNWMWLLIDVAQPAGAGEHTEARWEGYNYIVNRTVENGRGNGGETGGTTWLEKNVGGWQWKQVAELRYRTIGNELQLVIPRSALGLPEETPGVSLDFKWADNIQRPGDVMDFYQSGSVVPAGRFRYRYTATTDRGTADAAMPDRAPKD